MKKSPSETQTVKATTYCMSPAFPLLMHEGSKAHNFHISRFRSVKGLQEKWRLKGLVFLQEGHCTGLCMFLIFYLLLEVPTKYSGCLCLSLELVYKGDVEYHEMAA